MSDRQQSLRFLREDTPISFPFKSANSTASDLDQLDAEFMYTYLFKEILLDMKYNKEALAVIVAHWKKNKKVSTLELLFIDNFVEKYHSANAVRLYSRCDFIYEDLNQASPTVTGRYHREDGLFHP